MDVQAGVVLFSFWAMFFMGLSLKEFFLPKEDLVLKRLSGIGRISNSTSKEDGNVLSHHGDSAARKQIKERLLLAGLKRKSDLEKFLLFRKICFFVPFLSMAFLYVLFRVPMEYALLIGVAVGIVTIILPSFSLGFLIRRRRKEIRRFLPDTLDLFVIALEAGLSFDAALVRVAEEQRRVSTHISREFLYTNQEILVGKSREEALKSLSKRCQVDELDAVLRSVLQANKLGTSLTKTLRVQAESLRKIKKQNVHAQIMKAPVKLIFPLLFFIFPVLLVVIMGPSMVEIMRYLNPKDMSAAGVKP